MNKMKITLLIIIFSSLLSQGLQAQENDSTRLVVANIVTLHSRILDEDRKIYIYTPALSSFNKFPDQALPVMYLTDGDALAAIVSAQVNYLSTGYSILPPMIVVGINNYSYDRTRDLTPSHSSLGYDGKIDTSAKPVFKTSGGADKFLQFIKEEVMPYIEGRYKTAPFRILAGHSLGGLFSFHCLVDHPDLFNAYLSISPSLWWDNELELQQAAKKMDGMVLKNHFFFSSDANESGKFHKDLLSLDSLLKQKKIPGLKCKYIFYPDESHGSEPVKALYDGLRFLYPQWSPLPTDTTAIQVKIHYQQLTTDYGYPILPPEELVNRMGYRILMGGADRTKDAIDLFELNVTNYPASSKAYTALGKAFEKAGDKAKASASYQKAQEISQR